MILSLDVDGVLLPCDGSGVFAPEAVANVHRYLAAGYRAILHSAWRHDEDLLAQARAMFEAVGIPLAGVCDVDEPSKAAAIVNWVFYNNEGEDWPKVVVVDDDPLELGTWATQIQPSSYRGWVEQAEV